MIRRSSLIVVLLLSFSLTGCALRSTSSEAAPAHVWKQTTFADFSRGRLGDGGANTYVSAKGSVELVNRWDFNRDGHIDLVFANSHPHVEKLDATIYWGNGQDFDGTRTSDIPNNGAQWTIAADLNGDGHADAVIPNYTNGTWSKMDSYVYYGGAPDEWQRRGNRAGEWRAYPFSKRTSLPTEAAQNAAVGDLNKDGFPDIVVAQSAGFWEYRGGKDALASPCKIFWGSTHGYSPKNRLDLEAAGASDVGVGDLNDDGWLDLVIANRERDKKFDIGSYVYFGGTGGFSPQRRLELPTRQANGVTLADVSGDGRLDVLFANGLGDASYAYVNVDGTFPLDNRLTLPSSDARDIAVADVNGDGAADVFVTNHQTADNPLTLSYLYWGSPGGFAAERRQAFETLGAWGVSIADLNADGRKDIVVSNYKDAVSHDVPSYIYWNSAGGFSDALRTSVFTRGAVGNTIADFNGDGKLDVLFNNTVGRSRGGVGPLYVYFGDDRGRYAPSRRIELPSVEPYEWGAGDLDQDGWPDLIVANQAEIGRKVTENFVYWGGASGFHESRRTALVGHGGIGVSLADLDRNGYVDLIITNKITMERGSVFIYWGEPGGYVTTQRTELPGGPSGAASVADLNGDGHLDFVVHGTLTTPSHIYFGDGTRDYNGSRRSEIPGSAGTSNSEIADLDRDGNLDLILTRRGTNPSYIYHGDDSGSFSADRRSLFTPLETQVLTVGDLDRDGWLDVVAPTYKNGGTRATLSNIFMGGKVGISDARVRELPTNGGTGSQIADYNGDGHNDLLLVCHRAEGDPDRAGALSDHVTDSYLYWGGAGGLRSNRKSLIPSRGAHYDSGVDLGNIYHRGHAYDYVSEPHEYGARSGSRIEWQARTDPRSAVRLQVRTAESSAQLEAAPWVGPDGRGTYYRKSAVLKTPRGHSWIQYRAVLFSENGAGAPALEDVELSFR